MPPLLMIPNARDNAPNVNPVAEMPIDERPFRVRREGSHRAARIAPLTASLKDTLPPESRKGTRVAIRAFSGNIPGRPMSRTATPKAKKKKGAKSSRARKADATVNGGDGLAANGSARLSSVIVDSYNLELRDSQGFVGDRASGRAFRKLLEDIRKVLRREDEDPLGDEPSAEISKSKLDKALAKGSPEAAGLVHGAIEDFAQELAHVTKRFLSTEEWAGTERIVVGGGMKESRIGELVVGRAAVLLKSCGIGIDMEMIHHHPDEAGLIGCAHLAPAWIYQGHDSILAVDVGGSNIRCGIVSVDVKRNRDLSKASVWKSELWRHRDDKPSRDEAMERLTGMLKDLIARAEKGDRKLCPLIGIGVPGVILADGSIERGGQNLPGNWESSRFNLVHAIREAIPEIGEHETAVVVHNDAVVQGLSQIPFMQDVTHWGVLTIGTGLGNARFTNRAALEGRNDKAGSKAKKKS